MQFNDLKLDQRLLDAVKAAGFTTPTPIQREAIPVILEGGDLMASAQTGTGKTAAFVLPILDRILKPSRGPGKGPRVLVLTPTRELAGQIDDDIRKFSRFCQFSAGNIVGGVSYNPQIKLLSRPLDLRVATPGRLLDHMDEGLIDFSRLEVLVLDEADRMLDMGFVRDVRKITAATPASRQTLLFSATLEGEVLQMAREVMREPALIQLAVNARRHENITQRVFQADDADHKHDLLTHHLRDETLTQAVIFTRTKRRSDRLAKRLSKEGIPSAPLHGDMRQAARKRTVDQMKEGRSNIIVATDVAARGLDIKGISHVINFDLPMVAEDYIHRIGRTGRAGASGTAVTFVGPDEWELLAGIQRITGLELPRETVTGLEPATPEPSAGKPPAKTTSSRNCSSRNRGPRKHSSRNPDASARSSMSERTRETPRSQKSERSRENGRSRDSDSGHSRTSAPRTSFGGPTRGRRAPRRRDEAA